VTGPVEFLDLDDLVDMTRALVGDPPPIRDLGLLEAAAARPKTSVLGEDAYPDLWTKAAALLQSIVGNHPLVDGNKRLGWTAAAAFLEINGVDISRAENGDVYDLVTGVATQSPEVEEIAPALRRL
jgi:death-on-curing protein